MSLCLGSLTSTGIGTGIITIGQKGLKPQGQATKILNHLPEIIYNQKQNCEANQPVCLSQQ